MKYYFIVFCIVIASKSLYSQTFKTETGFEFFTDNREYYSRFGTPQTIMGSRGAFSAGYEVDSFQNIMFGGNYLIIHGENPFKHKINPLMYYSYNKEGYISDNNYAILAHLGIFERKTAFPLAMFTDSLHYFRPNTQGFNVKLNYRYKHMRTQQSFVFDWLELKNNGATEQFLAGTKGILNYKMFFINNNFYYLHNAQEQLIGGKEVTDNGTYSITIGRNFRVPLDKKKLTESSDSLTVVTGKIYRIFATVEAGNLYTWYKVRPAKTIYSQGLYANATMFPSKKTSFGATYYYGDKTHLILGDPLYRSGNYLRLDGIYTFVETYNVYFHFKYSLHVIQGELNHSQILYLKVNLYTKKN